MGKPDGWAKAWGLAAHVEPAGCMSGTCGVRGAQGPQMDYSKQIVPQGKDASNPNHRSYCAQRLRDLYYGDAELMRRNDELCGRWNDMPSGVQQGVPVTQPSANGMVRVFIDNRGTYTSYPPFATRMEIISSAMLDGRPMAPVHGREGVFMYVSEVAPGRHVVSGVRYNSPDLSTYGPYSTPIDVYAGGLVDLHYTLSYAPPTITRTQVFDPNNPQQAVLASNRKH